VYIDGHERNFVERWKEYERRFVIYGNDGNGPQPSGLLVPQVGRFHLILVKTKWVHKATIERKGISHGIRFFNSRLGMEVRELKLILQQHWHSLMVMGFSEARVLFKAGKNRDGYFDNDDFLEFDNFQREEVPQSKHLRCLAVLSLRSVVYHPNPT
jgi:hypothetical protein